MKVNDVISKEDLKAGYKNGLTVGDLKEFLIKYKLPDNAIVMIQRVEDVYFEKHHWGVYLKEGEHAINCRQWNKDITNDEYLNERPKLKEKKDMLIPFTEEQIREMNEQYHPAWSCVHYTDDKDILFIDLHY